MIRIEMTNEEFIQVVKEVLRYCPSESQTFKIIERKAKSMQNREKYAQERFKA